MRNKIWIPVEVEWKKYYQSKITLADINLALSPEGKKNLKIFYVLWWFDTVL